MNLTDGVSAIILKPFSDHTVEMILQQLWSGDIMSSLPCGGKYSGQE